MTWKHICFCHWRVPGAILAPHVPAGWEIDTFESEAWISIVPFAMENVRIRSMRAMPGFHDVPELNVRTYVRRGDLRAVLFFSLDARSKPLVYAARLTTGLPYRHAAMSLAHDGQAYAYRSQRLERRFPPAELSASYRPMGAADMAQPASLEEFLHERYLFVTVRGLIGQVRHAPYRLAPGSIEMVRNTMAQDLKLALGDQPDLCYYVERVEVRAAYGIE